MQARNILVLKSEKYNTVNHLFYFQYILRAFVYYKEHEKEYSQGWM
jgi:hypothetical protein